MCVCARVCVGVEASRACVCGGLVCLCVNGWVEGLVLVLSKKNEFPWGILIHIGLGFGDGCSCTCMWVDDSHTCGLMTHAAGWPMTHMHAATANLLAWFY